MVAYDEASYGVYLPPGVTVEASLVNDFSNFEFLSGGAGGLADFQVGEWEDTYREVAEVEGSTNMLAVVDIEGESITLVYATQPPFGEQLRVHIWENERSDLRPPLPKKYVVRRAGYYGLVTQEGLHHARIEDGSLVLHWVWVSCGGVILRNSLLSWATLTVLFIMIYFIVLDETRFLRKC